MSFSPIPHQETKERKRMLKLQNEIDSCFYDSVSYCMKHYDTTRLEANKIVQIAYDRGGNLADAYKEWLMKGK